MKNMEEEIIESPSMLCRVCFNTGIYKLNTQLDVDDENLVAQEMLKEFSSVEESNSDNIPAMLCSDCLTQLGQCYIFLKKVQRADEQIKDLFYYFADDDEQDDKKSEEQNSECNYGVEENEKSTVPDDENDNEPEYKLMSPIIDDVDIETEEKNSDVATGYDRKLPTFRKRPAKVNKKPLIVLTEKVSNIISRVQNPAISYIIEGLSSDEPTAEENEPPNKKRKPDEHNSLVVTKFVLAEPTKVNTDCTAAWTATDGDDSGGANAGSENNATIVNQIRTMDMTAVEIDASSKIKIEEIDDDTNLENPNTMYMCKYCPKAYSTSHHLIMHSRKSHVCQFCMQCFVKVDDLHRHTKEAHSSFKCTLCEKDFTNNSNLRQHIKRVHHIELPAYVSLLSVKKKDSVT